MWPFGAASWRTQASLPARCWMRATTAWWPARPTWPARACRTRCKTWQTTTAWCCHPSGKATPRGTGPDGAQADGRVAGRFSGNTAQALRKAALAGLGIALLPSTLTRRDLRAGLLVPVLPQYHRQGHGVHMVYPSRRYLPLAVSAFMELVISKMGAMQELPPQTCG